MIPCSTRRITIQKPCEVERVTLVIGEDAIKAFVKDYLRDERIGPNALALPEAFTIEHHFEDAKIELSVTFDIPSD